MFGHRTWGLLAPALALLGCGRFGFAPVGGDDAGNAGTIDGAPSDAGAACATFGPWDAPVAIAQVNSNTNEYGPALTPDGLTLLFTSERSGGAGKYDLYQASRASRTAPFSAPRNLTALNTAATEDGPTVTADGLTLYFCRSTGTSCQLYRATRPDRFADFADPQPVASMPNAWGPAVSRDGTELFYTTMSGNVGDLARATVSGTTITIDGPVTELNDSGHQGFATLSADGLTILFEGDSGSRVAIYGASRPAIGAPFTNVALYSVGEASSDDFADPDLSNSDRTLVFGRDANDGNGFDLYITNRSCL